MFDARRGGVVCGTCHGHGHGSPLSRAAREALGRAQSMAIVDSLDLELAPEVNAACRDALTALVLDHLGKPLKSLEFIAKLNASASASASASAGQGASVR